VAAQLRISANAPRLTRVLRHFAFAFLLFGSIVPTSAQAGFSKDQAVNWAVNSFVSAGASYIGITIPPDAVGILREMVLCGVDGGSVPDCARQSVVKVALDKVGTPEQIKPFITCVSGGKDLDYCAKQEGLKRIPEQVRPLTECLLGGGTVAACASKAAAGEIAARAPEQVRPLVLCMAQTADVAGCMSQVVVDQLPEGDARDMATCIRQGTPLEECAAKFAKGQLDPQTKQQVDDAISQIKELKADTENAMKEMRGSVANIVMVAQGIDEGDYAKIVVGGGLEIVKIVITAIVNYIVPVAAPISGPVVGAMVDLYGDTAKDVFNALYSGSVSDVAKALFKFYYGEVIAKPCGLIPDGDFNDATCGNAAKAIDAAASVVGDYVGFAYDIAREMLRQDPVGGWIADLVEGVRDEFFCWITACRKPDDCMKPDQYFAQNYFACAGRAASTQGPGVSQALQSTCTGYFKKCYDQPAEMCAAMGVTLGGLVGKIKSGMRDGAENFTYQGLGVYLAAQEKDLCQHGYEMAIDSAIGQFASRECSDFLKQKIPVNPNSCPVHSFAHRTLPHFDACKNAVASQGGPARRAMIKKCKAHCANPGACPEPPPCSNLLGRKGFWCDEPYVTIDKTPGKDQWKVEFGFGQQKIDDLTGVGFGNDDLHIGGKTADLLTIGKCKPLLMTDVVGSRQGSWSSLKTMAVITGFGACDIGGATPINLKSGTPKNPSGGSSGVSMVQPAGKPGAGSPKGQPSGGESKVYPGGVSVKRSPGGSSGGGTNSAIDRLGGGPSGGESKVYPGGVSVKRSPGGGSGGPSGGESKAYSGGGTNSAMDRLGGGPSGGETRAYTGGSPVKRGASGGAGAGAPDDRPAKRFGRKDDGGSGSIDYGFSSRPAPRPVR
jgi:hypothetical protein